MCGSRRLSNPVPYMYVCMYVCIISNILKKRLKIAFPLLTCALSIRSNTEVGLGRLVTSHPYIIRKPCIFYILLCIGMKLCMKSTWLCEPTSTQHHLKLTIHLDLWMVSHDWNLIIMASGQSNYHEIDHVE